MYLAVGTLSRETKLEMMYIYNLCKFVCRIALGLKNIQEVLFTTRVVGDFQGSPAHYSLLFVLQKMSE